jgi:hypothetical protein
MASVIVSHTTIAMVKVELGIPDDCLTISDENIREFIVYNGIYEPDFKYWNMVQELWDDWMSK